MNDNIVENIKKFIAKDRGISTNKTSINSNIEKDLNLYGDEAVEFIIAFGKEFRVDVSNFMAKDYFNSEGIDMIGTIERAFNGKEKLKKVLTIKHLEKAVIAGCLNEAVINS